MDVKKVPLQQFGIHFLQIGDDPDATEALKELDEQLGPDNGVRVSITAASLYPNKTDCFIYQDMVDTTPFSQAEPSIRTDLIVKVVLDAINSMVDQ